MREITIDELNSAVNVCCTIVQRRNRETTPISPQLQGGFYTEERTQR